MEKEKGKGKEEGDIGFGSEDGMGKGRWGI